MYTRKAAAAAALLLLAVNGCSLPDTADRIAAEEPTTEYCVFRQELSLNDKQHRATAVLECDGSAELYPEDGNALHQGVSGLIGKPFNISAEGNATLTVSYDEKSIGDIGEQNLCLLFYNEETDSLYDTVTTADYDFAADTITLSAPEDGCYLLVDSCAWLASWGMDLSGYEYAHDLTYTDAEFGFSFTIPKEISFTGCSDYLHDRTDGGQERDLLFVWPGDSGLDLTVQYIVYPIPYTENVTGLMEFLGSDEGKQYYPFSRSTTLYTGLGYRADLVLIGIRQLDGSMSYQYSGYYQIPDSDDENACIFISYSFAQEDLEALADSSLRSVRFGR